MAILHHNELLFNHTTTTEAVSTRSQFIIFTIKIIDINLDTKSFCYAAIIFTLEVKSKKLRNSVFSKILIELLLKSKCLEIVNIVFIFPAEHSLSYYKGNLSQLSNKKKTKKY